MTIVITPLLDLIIGHGNRGHWRPVREDNKITCVDGFTMSVIAGSGTYCDPRPVMCIHIPGHEFIAEPMGRENAPHDYPGPYDEVEVGYPSVRPEPWGEWSIYAEESDDPTGSVYGYVPVEMVRALVELHGGEL